MNKRRGWMALLLGLLVVGVVSCGGGSGSVAIAPIGIGGTGISMGTITGFGSVFVNGVEYETTDASITADDVSVGESALGVGMVVRVTGTLNDDGLSGTANSIAYNEALQGPVNGVPMANPDDTEKTLSVLGVDVIASRDSTVYVNTRYTDLSANDLIEVSGYYDANGALQATRIEKKGVYPGADDAEITGTIINLDNVAMTFGIQGTGVTVSFAGAVDLSDLDGGVLANGLYVEVKGVLTSLSTISASKVETEDEGLGENVEEASLEGIITDYASDASFRISGIAVDASGATREPTALILADGLKVEVKGVVENGVFLAERIQAEAGSAKLYANLSATDAAAGTVTLVIPGMSGSVQVVIGSGTEIEDEIGQVDSPGEVFGLTAGTFVRIEGYEEGGHVVAKQFKIDTADKYLVQGMVDAWDGGSQLTVLGLSFNTAGATGFQSEDDNDYSGESDFYSQLDIGDVVKAVDTDRDGTVDEVEYER